MTAAQVLMAMSACLTLACGQLYNGYINPLFLPRGSRAGRYLDTDSFSANPYNSNPYSSNPYSSNPYSSNPYSVNSYSANPYVRQQDDYRRGLLDPRYDDARRYQSGYSGLDRLYGDGLSRRLLPEDLRYLQLIRGQSAGLGLATTAQPALDAAQILNRGQLLDRNQLLDRSQLLDRNQLLDRSQLLDRNQLLDRSQLLDRFDRGQGLSTASPELSVTVSPNSST